MRNLSLILICTVFYSCQVLDKREVVLNPTFCKKCEAPLKEMLLKEPSIFVVKFNDDKLFYNYDASMLDVDSLENILMQRGFLPRKDSIVMYPVCCSKGSKIEKQNKDITENEVAEINEDIEVYSENTVVKDSIIDTII